MIRPPDAVERVSELMREFGRTWCLCGGWAVDAWLGRQSREHLDVDVAVFEEASSALFDHLPDWHLAAHETPEAMHDDPWDGHGLSAPAHVHARRDDWPQLEFMINHRSDDDPHGSWSLSRDPSLSVRIDEAIRTLGWGLPTLAPAIVLWYKARENIRAHDELDFTVLSPELTPGERSWLRSAISIFDRRHPWVSRL